jgi:hypothetical protein
MRNIFSIFGEIESIRILPVQQGQLYSRAFVCFKQPDQASNARASVHNQLHDGKHLFVTNYELPEIRKKLQADAKDKADFYSMKKQASTHIDPSLFQRPDTIQLIQHILTLLQRQIRPSGQVRNPSGSPYPNRPGN